MSEDNPECLIWDVAVSRCDEVLLALDSSEHIGQAVQPCLLYWHMSREFVLLCASKKMDVLAVNQYALRAKFIVYPSYRLHPAAMAFFVVEALQDLQDHLYDFSFISFRSS